MPGEPSLPPCQPIAAPDAQDASAVQCPVHRVEITPCDAAELAPLLAYLSANQALQGSQYFPRGAVLEDGRLDLCKQSLGSDNCLRIAQALQGNTQVRSLMLGTDAIGDTGAHAVAQLLDKNAHLRVLYLGCNNIGTLGARRLGAALAQNAQLTGLWLKRNPLGPEGAASIAQMLRSNRHLGVLDLVNTDLRSEGLDAIVDALCTDNSTMHTLYLSGNGLEPGAAVALSRLLREAPHVTALYLSVNRLGDEGAAMLADALHANRSLRTLELASNGIGPEGAKALFEGLRRHPAIACLNLGYAPSTRVLGASANRIGDQGVEHAMDMLSASRTLRSLNLTRNGVTARGLESLDSALSGNRYLGRLLVDGSLPEALAERLARNRVEHGDLPVPADRALIRSVYR